MKSALKEDDLFNKQSHKSDSVITDNNYDSNNSVFFYEIEWFLDKKVTNIRNKIKIKYLVKWLSYKSEWDIWYNIKNF